ncbi:MAG: 1-acyl-sn-glycerol-3-phosphate acyltransferase [Anaerolineaceae bacterium]|nr:1-acyl-sn-glycerol-3-phosphate acyltransferase [Anaerolineaceae bacterium]
MTFEYWMTSLLIKIFSKKPKIFLPDNINLDPPVVFVANHEKLAGPMMMGTRFPFKFRPWVNDRMLTRKKITDYVQESFFMGRLQIKSKWKSRFLSKQITPWLYQLMRGTKPIPVYQNQIRIIETFKTSVKILDQNENILIFPDGKGETNTVFNNISQFKTGFIYLAKHYWKQSRKAVRFIPVSINPQLPSVSLGESITYNPENNYNDEKIRISEFLMQQIDSLYYPPSATLKFQSGSPGISGNGV